MSKSLEETIAAVCTEILGVEKVDLDANLFELGADSVQMAQMVGRLRETIHPDLPLRLLFMAPTMAGMAREVEQFLLTAPMPQQTADDSVEGEL
ncbi:MAG TPA: phosphopantetheine-binding protein [Candidatus Limnocylindrales bacterium]|nr:phosphopantetheine-binding protein [Candidatus Limnocylindrales bacterium]